MGTRDASKSQIRAKLREKYDSVHSLKESEVIWPEEDQKDVLALILHSKADFDPCPSFAFLADRDDLLELAREILRTLDPVTNEQVVEKIRRLLEDQKRS